MKEPVNLFKCSVTCESKNSVYLLLCRSIVSNSVVHKYAMYFSVFLGQAGFTCQLYLPLSCVRATLKYHCAPKFLRGGGEKTLWTFTPSAIEFSNLWLAFAVWSPRFSARVFCSSTNWHMWNSPEFYMWTVPFEVAESLKTEICWLGLGISNYCKIFDYFI